MGEDFIKLVKTHRHPGNKEEQSVQSKEIRLYIAFFFMLIGVAVVSADGTVASDTVHFRLRYVLDRPEIDSTFVDNEERIGDIRGFLNEIRNDSSVSVTGVKFRGTASPDGPIERNRWLSKERLKNFKALISEYIDIPDSLIFSNTSDIPWDEFREAVANSDLKRRDEILAIIDSPSELVPFWGGRHIDKRLLVLKSMHGGRVWEELKSPILRDLRYGDAVFFLNRGIMPMLPLMPLDFSCPALNVEPQIIPPREYRYWMPHIYIKTNFAAWALFSANLAFEADFAPHWSFTLPVYYSALDYFKSTIKFRNFTVQPEFRYWPSVMGRGYNSGFFIGAHFSMCYYNLAFDGEYRYQDRRGRTPALGGGLAIGYRLPVSHNKRWHLEFSVGAGIYPIDYDIFENTPNYKEGQWVDRVKDTYIGIDQGQITLSYTFGLPRYTRTYLKKGGKK